MKAHAVGHCLAITLAATLSVPSLLAQDLDGDSIPDSIETQSWYLNAGGSPDVQDVWVECDWMPGTIWGQNQLRNRLNGVFNRAPVEGGIELHLTIDSMIPFEEQWGDFSTNEGYLEMWTKATAARAANFDGRPFTGADAATMRPYMHYCAFVNAINSEGSSGVTLSSATPAGGIPGDLFLVALGQYRGVIPGAILRRYQTGTVLHELGHNLGLTHGGAAPGRHTNYKPNYLSVMSYHYQGGFYRLSGGNHVKRFNYWDYSRSGSLKSFNERHIDEGEGILLAPGADFADTPAMQRLIGLTYCEEDAGLRAFLWNAPMDFDCNGAIDAGSVRTDTNLDGRTSNLGKARTDWDRLRFDGLAAAGAPLAGAEAYEPVAEMDRLLIYWMLLQDRRLEIDRTALPR
jgi:hypothetical protein